jgi:transcriptional repressor NrdR
MQCTHCQYPDSRVVYTKHDDFKNLIERRRECLRCAMRFTTHEGLKPIKPKAEHGDKAIT